LPFVGSSVAQSLAADITTNGIGWATLVKNDTVGAGTIAYYLSNNGGVSWESVTPGTQHDFTTTGSDLRFKIELSNDATVQDLSITYGGYYADGTITDLKLDAGDTASWGAIVWTATLNGQLVNFRTRVANDELGLAAAVWSSYYSASGTQIESPEARWMEIEASLYSDGRVTPVLNDFSVTYVVNAPPEVTVVTAAQNTDGTGTVAVTFDVRDQDTNTGSNTPGQVNTALEYWDGAEWLPATTVTGGGLIDLNTGDPTQYTPGAFVWNAGADYPGQYSSSFKIRVKANDSEGVHNIAYGESLVFSIDTKAPVVASVIADAADNNTLTFSVADDSALTMRAANTAEELAAAPWINYESTLSWNFGNGSNATVYYQFQDAFGNTTDVASLTTPKQPQHLTVYDVSNVSASLWKIFMSWQVVDEPAAGFGRYMVYRSTDEVNWTLMTLAGITDREINYYYDNSGLDNQTRYHYRVKTIDANGNAGKYSAKGHTVPNGHGGADSTPPNISNVQISSITDVSAVVTWNTNELSDSLVLYGTTDYSNEQGVPSMVEPQHSVTLVGLTPSTAYSLKVQSLDVVGNVGRDDNAGQGYGFSTAVSRATGGGVRFIEEVVPFETPAAPVLYDLAVSNITETSAHITWKTDKGASSFVDYGLTSNYEVGSFGDTALLMQHAVDVYSLSPATTYHIRARSGDAYAQVVSSSDKTFTTLALVPQVQQPAAEQAVTVEIPATETTTVTTTGSGGIPQVDTTTQETVKEVKINKTAVLKSLEELILKSGPELIPLIESTVERSSSFVAPPSLVYEPPKVEVQGNSAIVSWTTDKPANSVLLYSPSYRYDAKDPETYASLAGDPAEMTLDHVIKVTDLTPGTTYHFQARSKSILGGWVKSKDHTFVSGADTPEIMSYTFNQLSDEMMEVSWITNVLSNSIVKYTPEADGQYDTKRTKTKGKPELVNSHSVVLEDLKAATKYRTEIESSDAYNNKVAKVLPVFSTGEDILAPQVIKVKVESALIPAKKDAVQMVVTWDTDEPSSSQVVWQSGLTPSAELEKTSELQKDLVLKHAVIVPDARAGTTYMIRVKSADKSGNLVESKTFVVRTPQAGQSIIDVIVNVFKEAFGWTSGLTQ
jgi:hypothetical protein